MFRLHKFLELGQNRVVQLHTDPRLPLDIRHDDLPLEDVFDLNPPELGRVISLQLPLLCKSTDLTFTRDWTGLRMSGNIIR